MRYYIIISITVVLLLIIFILPNNYLGVYKDQMVIEYDLEEEDYFWQYDYNNDNITINEINSNKWKIKPINNGNTTLSFYYMNIDNDIKYKIIYKLKIKGNKIFWLDGEAIGLIDYPNPS